jgi:signal transduction histidine kinase
MLGIVHDLATAATEARRLDDPRAPVMDGVTAVADETIDVLRKLARGIRPAMLEEAGLAAALETLADEAPIPVVIQAVPEVRYPSAVEGAVWRVIARVVVAASRGGASAVRVTVDEADGRLLATIGVEDFAGVIDAVSLGDVVGAAGGDLRVMSVVTGCLRIVASVPCG